MCGFQLKSITQRQIGFFCFVLVFVYMQRAQVSDGSNNNYHHRWWPCFKVSWAAGCFVSYTFHSRNGLSRTLLATQNGYWMFPNVTTHLTNYQPSISMVNIEIIVFFSFLFQDIKWLNYFRVGLDLSYMISVFFRRPQLSDRLSDWSISIKSRLNFEISSSRYVPVRRRHVASQMKKNDQFIHCICV